jgi:hypothetical protein
MSEVMSASRPFSTGEQDQQVDRWHKNWFGGFAGLGDGVIIFAQSARHLPTPR